MIALDIGCQKKTLSFLAPYTFFMLIEGKADEKDKPIYKKEFISISFDYIYIYIFRMSQNSKYHA